MSCWLQVFADAVAVATGCDAKTVKIIETHAVPSRSPNLADTVFQYMYYIGSRTRRNERFYTVFRDSV